jgi:L-fucose/D-arabinose isomerase
MTAQAGADQIRVGLITVMSEDTTWAESFIRKFEGNHREARAALAARGFSVRTAGGGSLGRTYRQMVAQAAELRGGGIDVLVLYVPDWSYSSNAVAAALNSDVPVIVWSDAHPDQNGIVGAAIIRGALDDVGVRTKLVHGLPEDPETMGKIERLCRGIAAATKLRNTKFGIGGGRSMGMYTAHVDPSVLRRTFGVEIDFWEQVELIAKAQAYPPAEVKDMVAWLHRDFGKVDAKPEVIEAQARMYLALRDFARQKEYDAVCVKCLPELPGIHTTFCMAIALLNDRSDHKGPKDSMVCGCEADINATLTMQIMKTLNGGPVMFTDVLKLYRDKNEIGMANCGSSATDFAKSRKDVRWVKEGLLEFDWKLGGSLPQYITRAGRITLARLSRVDGEYVMLIGGGQTVEYPREKLKDINPQHPQSYVRMDCSLDTFLENLRCNHVHFVFGDFVEELTTACWVLGIRPIVLPVDAAGGRRA